MAKINPLANFDEANFDDDHPSLVGTSFQPTEDRKASEYVTGFGQDLDRFSFLYKAIVNDSDRQYLLPKYLNTPLSLDLKAAFLRTFPPTGIDFSARTMRKHKNPMDAMKQFNEEPFVQDLIDPNKPLGWKAILFFLGTPYEKHAMAGERFFYALGGFALIFAKNTVKLFVEFLPYVIQKLSLHGFMRLMNYQEKNKNVTGKLFSRVMAGIGMGALSFTYTASKLTRLVARTVTSPAASFMEAKMKYKRGETGKFPLHYLSFAASFVFTLATLALVVPLVPIAVSTIAGAKAGAAISSAMANISNVPVIAPLVKAVTTYIAQPISAAIGVKIAALPFVVSVIPLSARVFLKQKLGRLARRISQGKDQKPQDNMMQNAEPEGEKEELSNQSKLDKSVESKSVNIEEEENSNDVALVSDVEVNKERTKGLYHKPEDNSAQKETENEMDSNEKPSHYEAEVTWKKKSQLARNELMESVRLRELQRIDPVGFFQAPESSIAIKENIINLKRDEQTVQENKGEYMRPT